MIDMKTMVLEALGKGPAAYCNLVGQLMNRTGWKAEQLYEPAAQALKQLSDDDEIETHGEGLNMCWRLTQ